MARYRSSCEYGFIILRFLFFSISALLDIKERAEATLKATTEWKKEQAEREIIVNKKITMQAEHIRYIY